MTGSEEILNLTQQSFPLERYEPTSLLGRGALGEVYLAEDRLLSRPIAVKCLMLVDHEQIVIFQREAKIASKLSHPNIIATLDFGTTEGGRPFIAFEYFDGISLEQLISDHAGVLDEQLARRILIVVAKALSYIHGHKVFHRDLKPSNILLKIDVNGTIDLRIIDFGVSAIKEEFQNRDLVQGKTIVGTPVYMSPDPVRGEPFDARSEVYSIGCILFECLTGDPPFDSSSTAEVLELHMHNQPPLLKEVCPDRKFSPEIQEIVTKCLFKAKADRFQTMAELVKALERPITSPSPINECAPPVGSDKKTGTFRRSMIAAAGALLLVIAGVMLARSILSGPAQKDDVSRVLEKHDDLNELSTSHAGISAKTSKTVELEKTRHYDAQGIYLSGADSSKRLQEIADAKQTKETAAFNNVQLTPVDVQNLVKINPVQIQFFHCDIPKDVFSKLETIRSLDELNFHQCPNITPDSISELKGLSNLVTLRLIGCGITDQHMKEIGELKKLQRVVLDGNREITMAGLLCLKRKGALIVVWLNEGPLAKLTKAEIQALKEKHHIYLLNKLVRYEGDGGDGLNNPDALELIE